MANDIPDWSNTVFQLDQVLAGSPIAYINGTVTVNFAIPTGVHLLSIVLPNTANVSFLQVAGHTTGVGYFHIDPQLANTTPVYYVFIPYTVDASVDIQITASGTGNAYVSGVTAPLAVAELVQNPAPWQAPNQTAKTISFGNPGSGASQTVIPAPTGGQQIYLHTLSYKWSAINANVFGVWQDGTGMTVHQDTAQADVSTVYQDFKGCKLNADSAFVFHQSGTAAAGASFASGSITYAVY